MDPIEKFFGAANGILCGLEELAGIGRAPTPAPARRGSGPAKQRSRPAQPRSQSGVPASRDLAPLRHGAFRVNEVIEETGETAWVVTDGRERAVCSSAALAEKVRVALG